ncbi:hypothetical protein DH2020_013594 [Rehmannia glutinosa]|uniref:Uncharacterized protein n=1 Tax=Rehmannia glutinosa TaxID=99300 RepID=A0ABR0X685_REHGL
MACYAAFVSLAQVLDQILDHDQHAIVLHEQQQIKSLHENVILLSTFLEDFPGEAGNLEARITIAANEAEDIIEYHILDEISPEYEISPDYETSHEIGHHNWRRLYGELQKVIKEIDSIMKEVVQIKSCNKSKDLMSTHNSSSSFSSRIASSCREIVVGLDKDLLEIKSQLCGDSSALQIIPIVGMGGIGKTTLARYAYDDPLTLHHFDVCAWVTVSQNYQVRSILLDLLRSIEASSEERYKWMVDELLVRVYKYLKGRRYLIVMDDMWNTNVWDDVRRIFPDDCNGSRIIITTRELDVASYVDSLSHPYLMHLMDVDQSWGLLKEKVFGGENCPRQLEKIGKLIADNCRGLPLAIVVIAGVLSKVNQVQESWENIARNVNEAVNTSGEQFSKILSLSYTHLPHHLRPCFLYMGGFPEDSVINASKLIKLWAAEGFLKANGSKHPEEVAEEYLEDLDKRSLVLVTHKRSNGKIKAVKMHDLLRDLCIRIARDEKFLHVTNEFSSSSCEVIGNSRRLSICSRIWGDFSHIEGSPMRTILHFHHRAFNSWKHFRLLRVLDVMTVTLGSYPCHMDELFHLRYLALTFEGKKKSNEFVVPGSLSKLQNLQTLIIRLEYSPGSLYLPFEIWRMRQLRHLIVFDGCLPDPSEGTCEQILENVHTLSHVKRFTCSQRMLEMVPNIKKLGIIYSIRDIDKTGWSKYCLNNLVHLQKLEKLSFYVGPHDYSQSNLSHNLAFPVTLKKLTLSGCGLSWKDMTIVGLLPNLEVLKLRRNACRGLEWETNEGEFCRLKVLVIDRVDPCNWITESSHFPILECLLLRGCHKLREIPYGIGKIQTLQLIELDSCDSFIVELAKRIQEEVESFGNDLQLRL